MLSTAALGVGVLISHIDDRVKGLKPVPTQRAYQRGHAGRPLFLRVCRAGVGLLLKSICA